MQVNIARALYYDADVLIFDDPLSAGSVPCHSPTTSTYEFIVDAHVGKALFHDAILPLAKEGKTVLLVTHALHFLSHCDRIYAMDNGRIIEEGTYQQLISDSGGFSRLATEFGGHGSSSETSEEMKVDNAITLEDVKTKSANALRTGAGTGKLEGRLVVKEKRSTGSVSWSGTSSQCGTTLLLYYSSIQKLSACRTRLLHWASFLVSDCLHARQSDSQHIYPRVVAS